MKSSALSGLCAVDPGTKTVSVTNVFETARLVGREYELTDAEAAFEIYGAAQVMAFIGPKDVTISVAQQRDKLAALRAKSSGRA